MAAKTHRDFPHAGKLAVKSDTQRRARRKIAKGATEILPFQILSFAPQGS